MQEQGAPYVFSTNFVRLLLSLNFRNESSSATTELLQFRKKLDIVRRKKRLFGKISINFTTSRLKVQTWACDLRET